MDYSREKLMEIWQRAAPNTPPPELFDTLVFPEDGDQAPRAVDCGEASHTADIDQAPQTVETPPRCAPQPEEKPTSDDDPICGKLRTAEQGELALFTLYGELAKLARMRRQRGLSREFIRLGEDARLAAGRAASTRYLACGDCPDRQPVKPNLQSLREGIRTAWTLERALVGAYAGMDCEMEELVRLHSAHSLRLRQLLEISF